jgi:hypothetical protein
MSSLSQKAKACLAGLNFSVLRTQMFIPDPDFSVPDPGPGSNMKKKKENTYTDCHRSEKDLSQLPKI